MNWNPNTFLNSMYQISNQTYAQITSIFRALAKCQGQTTREQDAQRRMKLLGKKLAKAKRIENE